MSVDDGCPVCNSSQRAKVTFAAANVAEDIHKKARRDDKHRQWVEKHTQDGTLGEIRAALNGEL